jgi:hypothetical protein
LKGKASGSLFIQQPALAESLCRVALHPEIDLKGGDPHAQILYLVHDSRNPLH